MKLQRPQNRVLRTTGNFPKRTPICNTHVAFQLPHLYDFVNKLCRQQARVTQSHENANVRNIGQN
jgi:hypothetical protein